MLRTLVHVILSLIYPCRQKKETNKNRKKKKEAHIDKITLRYNLKKSKQTNEKRTKRNSTASTTKQNKPCDLTQGIKMRIFKIKDVNLDEKQTNTAIEYSDNLLMTISSQTENQKKQSN